MSFYLTPNKAKQGAKAKGHFALRQTRNQGRFYNTNWIIYQIQIKDQNFRSILPIYLQKNAKFEKTRAECNGSGYIGSDCKRIKFPNPPD